MQKDEVVEEMVSCFSLTPNSRLEMSLLNSWHPRGPQVAASRGAGQSQEGKGEAETRQVEQVSPDRWLKLRG